jgi:hypothetical protein
VNPTSFLSKVRKGFDFLEMMAMAFGTVVALKTSRQRQAACNNYREAPNARSLFLPHRSDFLGRDAARLHPRPPSISTMTWHHACIIMLFNEVFSFGGNPGCFTDFRGENLRTIN